MIFKLKPSIFKGATADSLNGKLGYPTIFKYLKFKSDNYISSELYIMCYIITDIDHETLSKIRKIYPSLKSIKATGQIKIMKRDISLARH